MQAMPIVLNIPPSIERALRGETNRPLDAEALEYAAVDIPGRSRDDLRYTLPLPVIRERVGVRA